jgi:hypothetical protein
MSVFASVEEEGFAWRDEQGKRWSPDQIIDGALELLSELIIKEVQEKARRR